MILSPGSLIRLGLLLLVAVVLQLSFLSQLGILGGHIDLVVLVVAAVSYYGGSIAGCATGFAAGFLLDLLSGATMGVSSLVLTAVGLRRGTLPRGARPEPRAAAFGGRCGRDGWLHGRLRRRVVHA